MVNAIKVELESADRVINAQSGFDRIIQSAATGVRKHALTALCVIIATAALLTPAIVNGYPFIFGDTGTYLLSAVRLNVPPDRPVFYSIFALLLHWRLSPWPIVIAQCLIVAILIRIVATAVFDVAPRWVVPTVAAVLTVGSSLPWFAGQITPDIFTSVLILVIFLVVFGWENMDWAERWFVLALVPVCVAVHNANFLVALSAIPAVVVLLLLGWRPGAQAGYRVLWVGGGMCLALAALSASNFVARGKLTLSPASSTFLLAKMLEDGPAMAVLEHDCPSAYPLVCSQLPLLQEHRAAGADPTLADFFLWKGPLENLGWFKPAVEQEASQIVQKSIAQFWRQEVLTAIANGARQFWHFKIGDNLEVVPYATNAIRYVFGNGSLAAYQRSLQANGRLPISALNLLHLVTLAIASVILASAAFTSLRTSRKELQIAAFLLAMLAGHAVAIGALTPLHERYQSRVVWLIPLFSLLLAFKAWVAVPPPTPLADLGAAQSD